MTRRTVINISLAILLLLVMSFPFIPKNIHEICGVMLAVQTVWHVYINSGLLKSVAGKSRSRAKMFSLLISLLLAMTLITIIVTGSFISNHLFKGWFGIELQRNIFVHQLHVSLPYALLILAGLHLGFNWQSFWSSLKKLGLFGELMRAVGAS